MAMRHDWLVEVALEAARRHEREVGWALRQLPPELRNFLFDDGSIGGVVAIFEQPAADQPRGRTKRREAMLEAFKKRMAARGEKVSNKQIYEAAQHSCRKPDFYAWLKGKLPDEASATKSLERFLAGDQRPEPRKNRRK